MIQNKGGQLANELNQAYALLKTKRMATQQNFPTQISTQCKLLYHRRK